MRLRSLSLQANGAVDERGEAALAKRVVMEKAAFPKGGLFFKRMSEQTHALAQALLGHNGMPCTPSSTAIADFSTFPKHKWHL